MTDVLPLLLLGLLLGRAGRGLLIWSLRNEITQIRGQRDTARDQLNRALNRAAQAEQQLLDIRRYYELDDHDHGDAA